MNLHAKMALLFGAMFLCLLLICNFVVYQSVDMFRKKDFLNQIQQNAIASATIVLRSDNLTEDKLQPFRQQMLQRLPAEEVNIEDMRGKSVYHHGAINPWPKEFRTQVNQIGDSWMLSNDSQASMSLRFDDGPDKYRVMIRAQDLTGQKLLTNLIRYMTLITLVGSALALILGRLLAMQSLKPIGNLIKRIESMVEGNLNQNLPVPQAKDELQRLTISFNHFIQRLQKTILSQKQMIALASHELRTPLTVIHAELDVTLMQKRENDFYLHVLESIRIQVKRLKDLNHQLLTLARSQSGLQEKQICSVHIYDLLSDVLGRLRLIYPMIKFETQIDVELEEFFEIQGDTELLRSVCLNLSENALKFHQSESPINIHIQASSDQICIEWQNSLEVFDIDFWQSPKIPFQRLENSQGKNGSGLGLALCENVAQLHQGRMQYLWDAQLKQITTALYLPRTLSHNQTKVRS